MKLKKLLALSLSLAALCGMFAGCQKSSESSEKSPAPKDIYQKIVKEIGEENMPALSEADADTLKTFYGISSDDLEAYTLQIPKMNVKADEFFIAKVKEGKMDAVKEGIEKRKADLDNTWKQYLPDVYETVKNAQTVENGSYILFAVSENAEKAVSVFNSETK
ncbi:DUF4358 domain-containing protein [Acidaminobacterium chupaoyuni]